MRAYPAALTPDAEAGFTVTFRNVPEAISEGDTREEALLRAEDALESALAMYIVAQEPLPTSSELARRLRWHLPQVSRLLDLRHASRMEHVEAALAALGLRLIVDVARAP